MHKKFTSLGLMSGTSGDGVDASIINSNGTNEFDVIKNKYFEYDSKIYKEIHSLKDKIFNIDDLKKLDKELKNLERDITLFHGKIVKELDLINKNILVGFHGQTIYHNSKEKVSKQLGNAKLLYQLTKKKVVYNFRANDILNGGEGAPLTPLFHQLIISKKKIKLPICVLNIGGISNITIINKPIGSQEIFSKDIGPGNCLIDSWVRNNSEKKFDKDGLLASSGKLNEIIYEQAQELYFNRINKKKNSYDINDFDVSFARGLSLEDGAATLTDFTGSIIADALSTISDKENFFDKVLVCGGGRKNKILLGSILKNISSKIKVGLIDEYEIDGDFVESQAFGYLAIRSYINLPITFPNTTNCRKPTLGGETVEN